MLLVCVDAFPPGPTLACFISLTFVFSGCVCVAVIPLFFSNYSNAVAVQPPAADPGVGFCPYISLCSGQEFPLPSCASNSVCAAPHEPGQEKGISFSSWLI